MESPPARFALVSSRVVTPDGVRPATVIVDGEQIAAVINANQIPSGMPLEDLGEMVISPGVVDSHVHINEPGRTEWEGFETATRAAAAGGVTTLVDMPLNSDPVTTSVAALEAKRAAAEVKCWVDVGFYGGLAGNNSSHIEPLIDAGACGIKCFLCHSGLDEFPAATETELRAALEVLARRVVPLLVHAELVDENDPLPPAANSHQEWAAMRPKRFEVAAIERMCRLADEYGAPVHIVHVSSVSGARVIAEAKHRGVPVTAEACPHYLYYSNDEIASADPRFKCAPAIGDDQDRRALWSALIDGTLDTIGSDHSPCPAELKFLAERDFLRAWGGIASLQLTMSIMWTGARARRVPLDRLSEWLSAAPARLIGMAHRKGQIAGGFDADLAIWNPDQQWTVDATKLADRHKLTPYDGEQLFGRVVRTYVRGHVVFDDGRHCARPNGQLLQRGK